MILHCTESIMAVVMDINSKLAAATIPGSKSNSKFVVVSHNDKAMARHGKEAYGRSAIT